MKEAIIFLSGFLCYPISRYVVRFYIALFRQDEAKGDFDTLDGRKFHK